MAPYNAAEEKRQGFYNAATQASALGDQQKAFQMQGLNQAENYYAPARARLNAAYGSPGSVTG